MRSFCEQSDLYHLGLFRVLDVLSEWRNTLYYHIEDECPLEEAHLPVFIHSFFRLVAAAFPLAEGPNNTPVGWPNVLATRLIPNLYFTHANPHNANPTRNRRQRQKQSKPPMLTLGLWG